MSHESEQCPSVIGTPHWHVQHNERIKTAEHHEIRVFSFWTSDLHGHKCLDTRKPLKSCSHIRTGFPVIGRRFGHVTLHKKTRLLTLPLRPMSLSQKQSCNLFFIIFLILWNKKEVKRMFTYFSTRSRVWHLSVGSYSNKQKWLKLDIQANDFSPKMYLVKLRCGPKLL